MTELRAYASQSAGGTAGQKPVDGSEAGSSAMVTKTHEFCVGYTIKSQPKIYKMMYVNDALTRFKSCKARYRAALKT